MKIISCVKVAEHQRCQQKFNLDFIVTEYNSRLQLKIYECRTYEYKYWIKFLHILHPHELKNLGTNLSMTLHVVQIHCIFNQWFIYYIIKNKALHVSNVSSSMYIRMNKKGSWGI